MRTSILLLLGTLAIESAAAQAPAPRAPRPIPPPRRAPAVAPSAALLPPLAPLAPMALMDQLDLLPSFEFELQLPHEPLLPSLPELDFQLLPQPMLAPLPPLPDNALFGWSGQGESRGTLSRVRPEQGTPEDSLFRAAREALNRGEYSRASSLFQTLAQRFPRARVAPSAIYWQAFALYRSGSTEELRAALEALKSQQERYPEAASDPDAATLRTRLYAALAARGDAQAATALRAANAAGSSCDREEMEVRAEALNALAQLNTPEARPTLKRVLARRDECSATLRRRAVYILGRSGTDEATADLVEVAKSDPDGGVRTDAIMMIARSPGATTVKVLEQLFNESDDQRTREAALSALRSTGGPEAKRALRTIIEKGDLPERTRAEAIQQLGRRSENSVEVYVASPGQKLTRARDAAAARTDDEDAVFLRGLYGKSDSRLIKGAILSAVARIGGPANDQWLLGIAKNREEDTSLRREALSRIKTSSLSIEELGKLFEALPERDLRNAVVNQLASRDDPAAVDKLIEIAKSGTDPQVRRQAIAALARKNDPRTTKLLLELVEKP
jgi:HEAT repeat protein